MLKGFRDAVCWLIRHKEGLLVITEDRARLVDGTREAAGLSRTAALALTRVPSRRLWFEVEQRGQRQLMRLNDAGAQFHQGLVARKQCVCPRKAAGRGREEAFS